MITNERMDLFERGKAHIFRWCTLNDVEGPAVIRSKEPSAFGTCAFYRDGYIHIDIGACAGIGRAGRAWSYPGYTVDRTPYDVLAHELGHHMDQAHGAAGGLRSHEWRKLTQEPSISGYDPNDNEWFAEMFRLFVTNPSLLLMLRPKMFDKFHQEWPWHVDPKNWQEILSESPRHINAASNKIKEAERWHRRSLISSRTQLNLPSA
jgi:hypothetical protein